MSYIEKHLMAGEEIQRRARLHWIVYLRSIILLGLGIILALFCRFTSAGNVEVLVVAILLFFSSAFAWLVAFVNRSSSEFAVTNKRVVVKVGWLRRRSTEILLRQVEGISVDQEIFGRLFDYGTIIVEGTGSDRTPYRQIAHPMRFRLAVQEQIEMNTMHGNVPTAPQQEPLLSSDPYAKLLKLNELKEKGILTEEEFRVEKRKILG